MSKEDLEHFLKRTPDSVTRACRVEPLEESPIPQLLHISMNTNIKTMEPRISARQMGKEDRTTPRVVAAPTLYGCILAYQSVPSDYMFSRSRTEQNKTNWKNGYQIYGIPYEFCLKPDKTLVPDVDHSDETWLVAYNSDTREYHPVPIGRVFCSEFCFVPRGGELPQFQATIYVEVTKEGGIFFSKNHKLDKGYWKIEAPIHDQESWKNLCWRDDKDIKVEAVTPKDWFGVKRSVADMLSIQDKVPAFLNW